MLLLHRQSPAIQSAAALKSVTGACVITLVPVRILLSLLLATLVSLPASSQRLTITHARLVDVTTGTIQPDTTVVVDANRITGVSHSGSAAPPSAAGQVVDARGGYLIPGLWDMHTHVFFDQTADAGRDLILPLLLLNGITGIRDMGSDLDPVLKARHDVAAHTLLGPRMFVSGPMLDGPKSTYRTMIRVATPEEGRAAVDMLKGRGVDFIKVQSALPRDAYFAIAKEANAVGIPFEGHVPDSIRASEAILSGQRTFEHLIGIFEASSTREDTFIAGGEKSPGRFLVAYDPAHEAAIIRLMAAHNVWQCPTLFWERGQWLVDAIDWRQDPDLAYAGRTWIDTKWPAAQKSIAKALDYEPLPVREKFVAHELEIVRKLQAAKIGFLAGTDTPAGVDVIPGFSLHRELQRFVAAGFTPLQALQTATLNPAKFYGRLNDFGSVQAGRYADLVLLTANPLDNIANTEKIAGVVADGRYLSRQDLDQLAARLKQVAATK